MILIRSQMKHLLHQADMPATFAIAAAGGRFWNIRFGLQSSTGTRVGRASGIFPVLGPK
jgi:hypothetical protein